MLKSWKKSENIFACLYYIGILIVLPLYNILFDWTSGIAARTYDFSLSSLLVPLGGVVVGVYLLLDRWVKPAWGVRIVGKALLTVFVFFGWSFAWTAYMPIVSLVDRLGVLPSVVCGCLLLSWIADLVLLRRERKTA